MSDHPLTSHEATKVDRHADAIRLNGNRVEAILSSLRPDDDTHPESFERWVEGMGLIAGIHHDTMAILRLTR